jgi:uncharacterized membrane protein YbhN (UPF0104 family)
MNWKGAVLAMLKAGFAGGILFWLFHKVNAPHVWDCMREAHLAPILIGILLCESTILVAAWRWQQLLSAFQIKGRFRALFCIAQMGQFFMIFLPGPTGDDLTRMLYISRLAKGRVVEACTSVAIDRLIGLGSILMLAVICIPFQWELLASTVITHWMAVAIVTFGGITVMAGIFFFLVGHPTRLWFQHQLHSLPAKGFRDEVARIWGLLCDSKPAVARVITAAVGTQILVCTMFYLAGVAVGLRVPMLIWMGVVPIILAASAVPITVAGIGVREYLLVLFLGVLANADQEKALAASLIVFAMILIVSLLGGIVYIFYRPQKDPVASSNN